MRYWLKNDRGKIWEERTIFSFGSKSLLNMTLPSLHVRDCLGWVIILTVHSHLWFIIPPLRFWVNAANSSQCRRYVQEKSTQWHTSSFWNTHKPSFSWSSSLKIAISSHTFVSEISNSMFCNKVTSCRRQINIQEVHLETSASSTVRLVTALTRSSLLDHWLKDFVWRSTSNHLFMPYKMYCSTLRAIDINGGSLAFVNSSHYWLVIKRCLTMFDYKSNIHMARLVPEWSSERDKKTPDLVSTIRAMISGLLYTPSVQWP